ncbi:hypothetical protein [Mucilaginibacter robiniae]|uniref:hypothetical protein n=1 Tax=Mucilaginibacter robiniae TaxID=2728022 RepID=UPI001B7CE294|nr:hypothetical protein [Mucilaginibacter robiniae]
MTDSTTASDTTTDDCPRAAAEPFIKRNVFPDAQFTLLADHKTGLETFNLADGDQVSIKESGCEYYTLSFRLETSRFAADTTDIPYWSNAAFSLLHKLDKGLVETPFDMEKMFKNVSARIKEDQVNPQNKLKLGEQIDFGGEDFSQFLIIDRVTRLADQRYALEFSMSYGPM